MRVNAMAVVLAINAALLAAIVWLWSDEERLRWKEPQALPPTLDDVLAMNPSEPADVSRFRETLERPLFTATRKMAPRGDAGGDAQPASDALKDVRLLGTYGAGGRGGIVISNGGKVERLAVGESLGGWRVVGGEGRGAALVRANGERRELELTLNTTTQAPPPAGSKTEGPEAPRPAEVERTVIPAAAQAAPSAVSRGGTREDVRRQRIERVNARRAQRGLPPLKE